MHGLGSASAVGFRYNPASMVPPKFGAYDVLEKIGAGGMGEVYRARDTRLGRDVAIKILPDAFASDTERLARFEREARLLASLNHPGIASIYGLESAGDRRFLVLELVAGEDWSGRIARGALEFDEALPIARDIAEALEYAHEQGVVHRDLKPANVKLTADGRVKVLDFGLAKALDSDEERDKRLSQSPTLLSSPTIAGVILGTAAYMSPEQARGKVVDKRADIFAFGCVLFEMLTGTQAFQGETVSDTLAAVLKTEPNWGLLPANTPRSIVELLHRCVQKDPKLRLRDIGEARIAIDHARHGGDEPAAVSAVAAPAPRKRRDLMWAAASVAVAALAFFGARAFTPTPTPEAVRKFTIDVPVEHGKLVNEFSLAASRDGSKVAYLHGGRLWVRSLSNFDAHELVETEGAEMPFFSADGEHVGYLIGNELRRISVDGGKSQVICTMSGGFTGGRQAWWTEDGRVVFTTGAGGIYEVNALGGEPKEIVPVVKATESDYHEVSVLPGNRGYLYVPHKIDAGTNSMALYANGERKELLSVDNARLWEPRYTLSGHIIFRRTASNSGIWALPFSLETLKVTGEAFMIAADAAEPCPAEDGTLVYREGGESGHRQLAIVDRKGQVTQAISEVGGRIGQPVVSPDRKRVAASIEESENFDIWVFDLERGTRTRLTFDASADTRPAWTPDGLTVVYFSPGRGNIMSRAADGTGPEQVLGRGRGPTITPDGKYVVYEFDQEHTQTDILMRPFPFDSTVAPTPVVATANTEYQPAVSPDGRYLAYSSLESGRGEVYLTRFPSGEGKWQVSTGGGGWARWARDGTRIYYQSNGVLSEVAADLRTGVSLGRPTAIVRADSTSLVINPTTNFDVMDGNHFVLTVSPRSQQERELLRIRIVQNWFEEFRQQTAKN